MRISLVLAASLFAATAAVAEEDAEAKIRGQAYAQCYGVYHAMQTLAEKQHDDSTAASFKERAAKADALARDAYKVNGLTDDDMDSELDASAEAIESQFQPLSGGDGWYDLNAMKKETQSCDAMLQGE